MKLQINSIVSYTTPQLVTKYGIVVQLGEFNNDEPAAKVFFGLSEFKIISTALIHVVNNNYSESDDYVKVYLEFAMEFNKQSDIVNAKLKEFAKTIKPKTIKKEFKFGGLYATPIITMSIIDKGNKRSFHVNNRQLDKSEIDALVSIINAVVGGLHIAPDTIKWGNSIGMTSHIREAINYYFLLA